MTKVTNITDLLNGLLTAIVITIIKLKDDFDSKEIELIYPVMIAMFYCQTVSDKCKTK